MTAPGPGWYAFGMPVTCPVCETDNSESAWECATCGRVFSSAADAVDEVPPVPGLEHTLHDPQESGSAAVTRLPDLEQTMLARRDLRVSPEVVPNVERTQREEDPDASPRWSAGNLELDHGRELDDGLRTPAPEDTGLCPWCSSPASGAVCDNCGRRRSRYSAPKAAEPERRAAGGESVLCPACFARVPSGARCVECGVPFVPSEIV